MASRAAKEYRYEKLTWPEINDAIELGKVCIVPCGAVEQHGPHLPLDVDLICPTELPGGCAHACELETSLYLYLDGDNVRKDQIKNGVISFNEDNSPFSFVDLYGAGPATVISWTSSYSETGVLGEAELATAEKGRQAYDEAVKQLVRFVTWFKERPKDRRRDRHAKTPTMPIPWNQRPVK